MYKVAVSLRTEATRGPNNDSHYCIPKPVCRGDLLWFLSSIVSWETKQPRTSGMMTLDLSIMESFVIDGIDTYPEYGFACPAFGVSVYTTICGLPECLHHYHGTSLTLPLIKSLIPWQMKHGNENSLVFPQPVTSESSWPGRKVECSPKDSVAVTFGTTSHKIECRL